MDERVRELGVHHAPTENLLCVSGTIEDALQIAEKEGVQYWPLIDKDNEKKIKNIEALYKSQDREYDVIGDFFSHFEEFNTSIRKKQDRIQYGFPYHGLLNLPNNVEDVRFRQEGVRELVENEGLFNFFRDFLLHQDIFSVIDSFRKYSCSSRIDPERSLRLIERLTLSGDLFLGNIHPESESIKRLFRWRDKLAEDTVYEELLRKNRRILDSRIFSVYTERFDGVKYGLLKPGIKPEDVFDFLHDDLTSHEVKKKKKNEERHVVKYKTKDDENVTNLAVGEARQRMDILNEMSSKILRMPAFLMMIQMKHLYQGAFMYKELKKRGHRMIFPEIDDNPGVLQVEKLLPIRMVLEGFEGRMATNSFSFEPEQKISQAEGPNNRGKSEAWRSLHLFNALTNEGYAVPAEYARTGIAPTSHFISCKGSSGHGGSELERSLNEVQRKIKKIYNGDQVILDELGDSTNAPTSLEVARRILPVLIERGCRVFLTSHHHTLTDYISKELGGVSFMPDPNATGVRRYSLVQSQGEIDFRAREVLNGINFTKDKLKEAMPNKFRDSVPMREDFDRKPSSPFDPSFEDDEDLFPGDDDDF